MKIRTILTLSLFSVASLPLTLAAQEVSTGVTRLGEITVEAAGPVDQPAGTGPATVVTRDQIERKQAGTLSDVLRGAPGVITANRGDALSSQPNIRGFGGTGHMANDPSSQVALDGVATDGARSYQNMTNMLIDPALLKQATVLTGPLASLAYGSGIAGGTVVLDTIDGADLTEDQIGFRFRQLLGANSNGDGWATSSTLAWQPTRTADFLLNYSRRAQDEQDAGGGVLTGRKGFNLPSWLLKARVRIDETNSVGFSYNRSSSAQRDVPYAQASGSPVFGNVNRDRTGTTAAVTWNHTPAGNDLVDVEVKFSRSEQEINMEAVVPGHPIASLYGGRSEVDTNRLTVKNTALFSTGAVSHRVHAGIDWSRQSNSSTSVILPASSDYRRLGVFAIDNMDFGNELRASFGLRIERQKIEGVTQRGAATGPFSTTARTVGAGIEKGIGLGFTGFASFTYGEALATADVFHQTWPAAYGGAFYGEGVQQSRNWELGVKYQRSDLLQSGDDLTGSITAYQTDVWNAMFGPTTGGTGAYPSYKMRGVDLNLGYASAQGLYADGTLTLANHSEQSYSATAGAVWRDYLYVPANQVALTLGKRWDNGWDVAWSLQAAERRDINGTEHAGWGVNDLSVRYTPQSSILAGATIDFAVENVFDKRYKQTISSLNEPGRNYKLTISKTF